MNRIKGLLALHGTRDYQPLRRDRRERLETLATANGQLLPPRLRQELGRELDRLELVLDQIASLSTELQEASADAGAPATAQAIQPASISPANASSQRRSAVGTLAGTSGSNSAA